MYNYSAEQAPITAAALVPAMRVGAAIVDRLARAGILTIGVRDQDGRIQLHVGGGMMDEALMVSLSALAGTSERVDPVMSSWVARRRAYEQETWSFGPVDVFWTTRRPDLDPVVLVQDCESFA